MLTISNTPVFGFEGAISGMRNPYESRNKSDSKYGCRKSYSKKCWQYEYCVDCPDFDFVIGEADMTLAKKLTKAGTEHGKFARMIHVQADITAPRRLWVDIDTYKFMEKNSSSTMHLITKRHLSLDDFTYNDFSVAGLESALAHINELIDMHKIEQDKETKDRIFIAIKDLLPESFLQLRTIDTNYTELLNIYRQRRNHRQPEFREFCEWMLTLPYFRDFVEAMEK